MSKKPVPKKKQAVSSTRSRNSKYVYLKRKKLAKLSIMKCKDCGATKRAHFACPECGKYNGREVLKVNKEVQPVAEIAA